VPINWRRNIAVMRHLGGMTRRDIRRWVENAIIILLGIFAAIYIGDFVTFKCHFPPGRTLLSTINVKVFYMIPIKGGKVQIEEADPETQVCSHSLFSQGGYPPCWRTKNVKWVDLR